MNTVLLDDFSLINNNYSEVINDLKGKVILVTGSTGMITSYLCLFLLSIAERNSIKLILQCRNKKKAEKIFSYYIGKPFLTITSFDFEQGEISIERPDFIIHAASAASTKFFIESPVDVMAPNIVGTWNLLNYCRDNHVAKFLFFSSNSIYGEGGIDKDELTEDDYGIVDPLNERSCYIESKRASEQMCRAFWKQYNVPISIIRICHTYGPTFDIENDMRIIPRTIKKILKGEDVVIYKDPHSVIQYTYIADMVAAILVVLTRGAMGEAYNSGGDEIVKMDDVIEWMICADKRIKSRLIEKEIDSNYSFAQGKGVNFVKLSNNKIRAIGWKPMFTNEDGFKRTVLSYF